MTIQRSRPAAETALIVLTGGAFTAGVALRLDLTPALGLRAAMLLAVFLVPWGGLLARIVDTGGLLTRGERCVLVLLLGYPAGATVYYLLARLQADRAFVPLSLAVAAAVWGGPARRWWRTRTEADRSPRGRAAPPLVLALVVPLVLFTLTLGNRAFAPTGGGLVYAHSTDHS
ncbi:MAG TPA: hypothetical protein VGQ33_03655, partial [Vicinamibacteria bacterium]|nr:hypothetical protein [Vicinamibacteria bacterium]